MLATAWVLWIWLRLDAWVQSTSRRLQARADQAEIAWLLTRTAVRLQKRGRK